MSRHHRSPKGNSRKNARTTTNKHNKKCSKSEPPDSPTNPRINPNRALNFVLADIDSTSCDFIVNIDFIEEIIIILSDLNSESLVILKTLTSKYNDVDTYLDMLYLGSTLRQFGSNIDDIWVKHCNSNYEVFKKEIHEFRVKNLSTAAVKEILQKSFDNWVDPEITPI